MSQIELKKTIESNQIETTIESNQIKKQLSLIKSGIVSRIQLETAARMELWILMMVPTPDTLSNSGRALDAAVQFLQ